MKKLLLLIALPLLFSCNQSDTKIMTYKNVKKTSERKPQVGDIVYHKLDSVACIITKVYITTPIKINVEYRKPDGTMESVCCQMADVYFTK